MGQQLRVQRPPIHNISDLRERCLNICKNAKLDNSLISTSKSSCASASNSNAKEPDEQILEVKINPQEKNTVSDTSANNYTLSKEKELEDENEETDLNRSDFAHYADIYTHWCAKIKDEVEKLAYQLNEEAERTERPTGRLSKVMYGSTCADMVDVMGECLSSIKHVVGHRFTTLETISNQEQLSGEFSSGRPRGTTPADDRHCLYRADETGGRQRRNRQTHDTGDWTTDIAFTVARRLHGGGLFARCPVRCVPLTPAHRRRRSLWCREHRN
ncbi:transposable element Tc1 transposase [Trichonephila clavipes]|nr:transposable element Tc1 transposase [Trichonephila clavipes]